MGVRLCCADCHSSELKIHLVGTFNEVETQEPNPTMMPPMYTSYVAEREHVPHSRLSMSTPVFSNHGSKNSSITTSSGATETVILPVKNSRGYVNTTRKILSPTTAFHESKLNGTVSSVIDITADDDERSDRDKSQWFLRSNSFMLSYSGTSIFRLQQPDPDESFSGNGTTNISVEIKDVRSNISSKFPSSPESGTLHFKHASMSQMLQKLFSDATVFSQSLEQASDVAPRLKFTSTVAKSKE